MAKKERKQMTDEERRKRSEAIQKIVLPVANAASASFVKVLVEHLFRGA